MQLASGPDVDENVRRAGELVRVAADQGAELVVLPEYWNVYGPPETLTLRAEPLDGPSLGEAAELSRRLGIWLAAGTIVERATDGLYDTAVVFSPRGEPAAVYRKMHLFHCGVEGAEQDEASFLEPGSKTVSLRLEDRLFVGLAVCYDLRFPEMFRDLAEEGVDAFLVPSAFTAVTGRDHWELLVRARALDNLAWVVAPNQGGRTGRPGVQTFGHSIVCDPWGGVVARAGAEGDAVLVVSLEKAAVESARSRLPGIDPRSPTRIRRRSTRTGGRE